KELRAGGEGGIVRLRATRFGEISFLSASHLAIARRAIQSERRRMAERVGFVRLRATRFGEISFLSASHLAIARSAIQSERRRVAEGVGLAPQLGIETTDLNGVSVQL